MTNDLHISSEVRETAHSGGAVVALESTVISHGLPRPKNLEVARQVEEAIRREGAVPATIGVINGILTVGLNSDQLEILAFTENVRKVSRRDFGIVMARKEHGATTVAGTMIAAHMANINVFSTGGIGGVHRGDVGDVSADLPELAKTPVAVVCAGAKSILDLPRTIEWLETSGVPVLGYQTDTFPAFYAVSSGLPVDARIESPEEVAKILYAKWDLDLEGGALITVPPPAHLALPKEEMEVAISQALNDAEKAGVMGKEITPFLLSRVSEITAGRSLEVNIALLIQNAQVATQIAIAMSKVMYDF